MSHVAITYDPHSFIRHTQVGFCSVELMIASSHSRLSQRHTFAHVCWGELFLHEFSKHPMF